MGNQYYSDVRKFVRRIDNDLGIPFLIRDEYETAKKILSDKFINIFENSRIIALSEKKVFLRGERYYLNNNQKLLHTDKTEFSSAALSLLEDSLKQDLAFGPDISNSAEKAKTLEERMVVGSLLDLYRNHLLILFTGLYESMKLDSSIPISHYDLIRGEVENIINDYYKFTISGKQPNKFIHPDKIVSTFAVMRDLIKKTQKVYDGKRYLAREFDHPGRLMLYASNLLSQIKEKNKRYDLLVNLLNGSAEIGLAVQVVDALLNINRIRSTTIFEVDFARYSRKDRLDKDVSTYSEFEHVAIPSQLRNNFKNKIQNKDVLVVDDNLNTGQSLFYVKQALEELANSVDISAVETVPIGRVIELIKQKNPGMDPHSEIKLIESNLTYSPIGWWRDQVEINKEGRINRIISI